MKKSLPLIFLFIVVINQSFTVKENQNIISQDQAIKLAEQFIRYNGYTSEKPDTSKISFEFLFDREIKETLKLRHNSLQQKAFCYTKGTEEWNIGFLATNINIDKLTTEQKNSDLKGRAVKVSFDGQEIRMAHKEPRFSNWTKL